LCFEKKLSGSLFRFAKTYFADVLLASLSNFYNYNLRKKNLSIPAQKFRVAGVPSISLPIKKNGPVRTGRRYA